MEHCTSKLYFHVMKPKPRNQLSKRTGYTRMTIHNDFEVQRFNNYCRWTKDNLVKPIVFIQPWILKIESRINQFYLLHKMCFGQISMNGVVFNLKRCLKSWIMNIQLDVWVAYHMMCHVMWHHYFLTRYDDNAAWHSVTFVTWVTVSLPSSHRQRISDQEYFGKSKLEKN